MTYETGEQLPLREFRVTRADLVRYAGASGDFNPIHWSDRTATAVGLPGVIAHGMYTMALGGRALLRAWFLTHVDCRGTASNDRSPRR